MNNLKTDKEVQALWEKYKKLLEENNSLNTNIVKLKTALKKAERNFLDIENYKKLRPGIGTLLALVDVEKIATTSAGELINALTTLDKENKPTKQAEILYDLYNAVSNLNKILQEEEEQKKEQEILRNFANKFLP